MRKNLLALFLLMISWSSLHSQTFQRFVGYLNSLPESARQTKVDSFMTANTVLPYFEADTLCTFVYNGTATSMSIAGDFSDWNPNLAMNTIPGTTFWYLSRNYPNNSRLDYKLVRNGGDWFLDPKNPFTCTGGYGTNSELRMPAYVVPPEISYDPSIPHGTIRDTTFFSTNLSNSRIVKIYLPPYYNDHSNSYPVLVFHDGLDYLTLAQANNILDYLIHQKLIVPVIGVFVPPVKREAEYCGAQKNAYTAFIVSELMSVIDHKYRTSMDPHKRATLGISNGGNIALYLGMKHPECFGLIGAQSSNIEKIISSTFRNSARMDLSLYIDIGKYDISRLIPLTQDFMHILDSKGYNSFYRLWNEGHSWGNWKGHLRSLLIRFFAIPDGLNENLSPAKSNINN